jgi:three-Cys-motif partner protein
MAENLPTHFFSEKRSTPQIKAELLPPFLEEWARYRFSGSEGGRAKSLSVADLMAGQGLGNDHEMHALALWEMVQLQLEREEAPGPVLTMYMHDPSAPALLKLKAMQKELHEDSVEVQPSFLDDEQVLQQFSDAHSQRPSLLYLDPFGYPFGQQLLVQAAQHPATDLLLLFPASRLGSNLLASLEAQPLGRLMISYLSQLESYYLAEKATRKRERFILTILEDALKEKEYYTCVLKINLPHSDKASHYLFFASKERGLYFMAKEFMSRYSHIQADGVPAFFVNQAEQAPVLPGFQKYLHASGVENLADELAGRRSDYHYLSVLEIFEHHSPGTPYLKVNYKAALARLRDQGCLSIVDAQNKRMKTIEDHSIVFYKLHGLARK